MKPIIKLFNRDFSLVAMIDDWEQASFEHNLYSAGAFTITINYNIPNARLFQRGLFVQFGDSPYDFGEIITVSNSISSNGKGSEYLNVTGYDARYLFKRRIIKNLNSNDTWSMTAKGELCLRSLVADQCGTNAETKRQLPINNTIPEEADALGSTYSVSESYSNLYDVLVTIATQSEIGWAVTFNGSSLNLVVFNGTDKSSSVFFSTDFESLASGNYSDSSSSFANSVYIGGKGTGSERDIYEGEVDSPEGLDRFEAFDNQSSMTTEEEYEAEAESILTQYGQTISMNGQGLVKSPYVFRSEYDIGDIIKLSFSGKSANIQILSVTEAWSRSGGYALTFSFGKPVNTLDEQLNIILRKIQEASSKTSSTDSVKWYTTPTETAQDKSDVTFDTLGFTGSGGTFTLYLDDEKTGSKSYHLYIKNLTSSLVLTTGRSATNLTLISGSYIANIFVDEDGNIINQGMTATNSVVSGNTQPVTSGAVADVLDIPKDAVVHYSFDDLPDMPDGTAVYKRDNDFTTNDVSSAWNSDYSNTTASVSNGVAKWVTTDTNIIQLAQYINNIAGKTFKIKFRLSKVGVKVKAIGVYGGTYPELASIYTTSEWNELIGIIPSNYTNKLIIQLSTDSVGTILEIEQIYIGDGSYNTPVIDNSGKNNHATNNGAIAVSGVSGKAGYFLNGKYVQLDNFNFSKNFSVSLWVKADNNTNALYGDIITKSGHFILRNGATWGNYLMVYLYNSNGNTLLDNAKISDLLPSNTLVHICFIRDGLNAYAYFNGSKVKEFTLADDTISQSSNSIVIGGTGNTRPHNIDDILFFNRALSEKEVIALYQNKANTPKYYNINNYKLIGIPDPPSTDGNYVLVATISSGKLTYSWEAQ